MPGSSIWHCGLQHMKIMTMNAKIYPNMNWKPASASVTASHVGNSLQDIVKIGFVHARH